MLSLDLLILSHTGWGQFRAVSDSLQRRQRTVRPREDTPTTTAASRGRSPGLGNATSRALVGLLRSHHS